MKTYFLETSIIIDYLRGKGDVVNTIDQLNGKFVSSYICLSELYEGIHRSKSKRAESSILKFFSGLHEVCGLNQDIAKKFGFLRKELKQKGQIIEDLDVLIAATCLVNGFILVTNNLKHYSRIKGLDLLK